MGCEVLGGRQRSERADETKTRSAGQTDTNSMKDQLQKGQNALSETAKNELVRNIDVKTKSFNRDMEDAQAEFEQEQQKILQELGGRMMAVIDKYAKDNSYTLILDVSSPQTPVLFASNTIDITKDIIDLYDKNAGGGAAATKPAPGPGVMAAPKPVVPATPRPTTPAVPKPPVK